MTMTAPAAQPLVVVPWGTPVAPIVAVAVAVARLVLVLAVAMVMVVVRRAEQEAPSPLAAAAAVPLGTSHPQPIIVARCSERGLGMRQAQCHPRGGVWRPPGGWRRRL
jgi:hypothetical protein